MRADLVRRAAPAAGAVAVLAVLIGSTQLFGHEPTGTSAGGSPPPLHIGVPMAAAAANSTTGGAGRITVSGRLPDGPSSSPVYRFGSSGASAASIATLARALDVDPAAVARSVPDQGRSGPVLVVGRGPAVAWRFARANTGLCLGALPGEDFSNVASGCAYAARPGTPVPVSPSRAAAIAAARPVLAAVGLDVRAARVEQGAPGTTSVWVDPLVGGQASQGFGTEIQVDRAGVVSGSGWLGAPVPGRRYPVISAREALRQLESMPMPMLACAQSEPATTAMPLCGGVREVTGATLGRTLQWDNDRPVLVPSWFFSAPGTSVPVAVVAIDPAYLAAPHSQVDPGSSGYGGSEPGAPGTGKPGVPQPTGVPPAQPNSRFDSVAPTSGGTALTVGFTGGVESCYHYRVVAKESSDRVALVLVEDRSTGVCDDMAQIYRRTVLLDHPLGARQVVDGGTGQVLYPVPAVR
jgi:hypothetical protein